MLYLDNAASTKVDSRAINAMKPYWNVFYGNNDSKYYSIAEKSKSAVEEARKNVASLVNCSPSDVVFTSGATESNNMLFKGIWLKKCKEKIHIIVSQIEHSSINENCLFLDSNGVEITYVSVDENGLLNIDDFRKAFRKETALVSVIWVNNEIGTIQNMKHIDEICFEHGVDLHSDVTQAVGKIDIDVEKYKALKYLTFSSHKIYGPKGIGTLIIKGLKEGLNKPIIPLMHGGEQEYGLRAGTISTPLIVGFGTACSILVQEFEKNNSHLRELDEKMEKILVKRGAIFNVDKKYRIPGLFNIWFNNVPNQILLKKISSEIAASSGSACGIGKPSKVLKAIGLDEKRIRESVRLSVSCHEDLEALNTLELL